MFPLFKWEIKLKMIWVILVIVEKVQMTREKVNNIIDFIVSGIEVAGTRDSVKELAAGANPDLRQLLRSSDRHIVQGTEMTREDGTRVYDSALRQNEKVPKELLRTSSGWLKQHTRSYGRRWPKSSMRWRLTRRNRSSQGR